VVPLIKAVLEDGKIKLTDISAIAYTAGPGLAGALLVGSAVAKSCKSLETAKTKVQSWSVYHRSWKFKSALPALLSKCSKCWSARITQTQYLSRFIKDFW
jgi:hypothetical protein